MCNNETLDHFVTYENQQLSVVANSSWLTALYFVLAISFILILVGSVWWAKRSKKRGQVLNNRAGRNQPVTIPLVDKEFQSLDHPHDRLIATSAGDTTLREVFDHSITSGSGSGLPVLIPRTLSNEIELLQCIGKGRFCDVWKGKWKDDIVCVKIFLSREETLFNREREIQSIVMLRHPNILGYIGSDVTSLNSCTELRLFLHYHPLGSLYDYLSDVNFCSTLSDIISILRSAVAGLNHLHTRILGTQGKSGIAHRDIKSKNILLKNHTAACIGDFGLAAIHNHATNTVDIANPHSIGTTRYAAPEVLDGTIRNDFESYKMSDVYSFSLVMWESCQRAALVCEPEEYRVPYYEFVTIDPSVEEMKKVVSLEGIRPSIPDHWTVSDLPQTKMLLELMAQSWSRKPESRLTALNIKKKLETLSKISSNIY